MTMMMDSVKMATLCAVLKNIGAMEMLSDLLEGDKTFGFFMDKYGKAIVVYRLEEFLKINIIKKIFIQHTKTPIGYRLTDKGRWITHACIGFEKQLETMPQ